jgi:ankyrin repeat protein
VNAAQTNDGYTALMWASQNGHVVVVRELCKCGANVNATRFNGMCALMAASSKGHLEVVRELCEWGSNVNAARHLDGADRLDFC